MNKLILCFITLFLLSGCATDPFDIPRADVPFPVSIVNDNINDMPAGSDDGIWNKRDYWATPKEFYEKGAGDCEDYAIAKYFALRKAGIPASKMFLTAGFINNDSDKGHMVLIVTNNNIQYVLDNMVDGITKLSERPDFNVLYSFNENIFITGDIQIKARDFSRWKTLTDRIKREN